MLQPNVQRPSAAATIDAHAPCKPLGWTTIEFAPLLLSKSNAPACSDVEYIK